jgi:DNA modification methylase
MGTGTTNIAAARWGRNSMGFEIDRQYFGDAIARIEHSITGLFSSADVNVHWE